MSSTFVPGNAQFPVREGDEFVARDIRVCVVVVGGALPLGHGGGDGCVSFFIE